MGHLMMDSKGCLYDSFDCLSFHTSASGSIVGRLRHFFSNNIRIAKHSECIMAVQNNKAAAQAECEDPS